MEFEGIKWRKAGRWRGEASYNKLSLPLSSERSEKRLHLDAVDVNGVAIQFACDGDFVANVVRNDFVLVVDLVDFSVGCNEDCCCAFLDASLRATCMSIAGRLRALL